MAPTAAEKELQEWLKVIGFSDINEVSDDFNTPMHLAFEQGKLEFAKMMRDRGCSLRVRNVKENLPTILAAEHGHLEMLKWAKEVGEDILTDSNQHGDCSITMATFSGHLEVMEYLYECGVDLHRTSSNGFTLAMIAAENDRLEALKWLVKHGCDLNQRDGRWNNPIIVAAHAGHVDIVKYLLEQGVDFKSADDDKNTPLMLAAAKGSVDIVRMLLERGANVYEKDSDDESVGQKLAGSGSLPALILGLEHGILMTPKLLKSAIESGNVEMVKFLRTKLPLEPSWHDLGVASANGHVEMLEYLVSEFPDVDWNLMMKGRMEPESRIDTDNVWEALLFFAVVNNQLSAADHILAKHGLKVSETVFLPKMSWLVAKGSALPFGWLCKNGLQSETLVRAFEEVGSDHILSGGVTVINWMIENGWKGEEQEEDLLNPWEWPVQQDDGAMLKCLAALTSHFGWTREDLGRTFEVDGDDEEVQSLTSVLYALAEGDLDLLKFLVDKMGCALVGSSSDQIQDKAGILNACFASNSLGVVRWVLQRLDMHLPNVFIELPPTEVLSSPTLGFRREDWARIFELEDDESDDESAGEVIEDSLLRSIVRSDDLDIFSWCFTECLKFGIHQREQEYILQVVLERNRLNYLSWLVEHHHHCFQVPILHPRSVEIAIGSGAMECAEWLYASGVPFSNRLPLYEWAFQDDATPKLRWLFRNGILEMDRSLAPDIPDLLHFAVLHDNLEGFLYMLRQGVSIVNQQALINEAKQRSPSIFQWFLENGFSVT
jgi:hypothetical protein